MCLTLAKNNDNNMYLPLLSQAKHTEANQHQLFAHRNTSQIKYPEGKKNYSRLQLQYIKIAQVYTPKNVDVYDSILKVTNVVVPFAFPSWSLWCSKLPLTNMDKLSGPKKSSNCLKS